MAYFDQQPLAQAHLHQDCSAVPDLAAERRNKIFDGALTALDFNAGLSLHTLNATSREAFEFRGEREPSVVLLCFLEGSTAASLGGKAMNLGRRPGEAVEMVLTSTDQSEQFWRRSERNEYVRKVSISMSQAWLQDNDLALSKAGGSSHGADARVRWVASSTEIRAMEQLASARDFSQAVDRLQAHSLTLGLISDCFSKVSSYVHKSQLSHRECMQLRRFDELIHAPGSLPSVSALSRDVGVSPSSLRRLILAEHGCSVGKYIRKMRMEIARTALECRQKSIAEAAYFTGYSSPENFSTAFKRHFGYSPSERRHAR